MLSRVDNIAADSSGNTPTNESAYTLDKVGNWTNYVTKASGTTTLDQTLFYMEDANFNVTGLVNTSGTVVERDAYSPYGQVKIYDGSWNSRTSSNYSIRILYAGYRWIQETGLYDVRHRMYNPSLGEWMQRDPMGYVGGYSLYQYCDSNTLKLIDPYGLFWGSVWHGIVDVGAGMVGGAITGAITGGIAGAVTGPGILAGIAGGAVAGAIAGGISAGLSDAGTAIACGHQSSAKSSLEGRLISGIGGGALGGVGDASAGVRAVAGIVGGGISGGISSGTVSPSIPNIAIGIGTGAFFGGTGANIFGDQSLYPLASGIAGTNASNTTNALSQYAHDKDPCSQSSP